MGNLTVGASRKKDYIVHITVYYVPQAVVVNKPPSVSTLPPANSDYF